MEWEDKDNINKTWGACKIFFNKYFELKKRYRNAGPDSMGFESAANVTDKSEMENDELKNYLDRLSDTTRTEK